MKKTLSKWIEDKRIRKGPLASNSSLGNNGAFLIPHNARDWFVIISDAGGWDHVSVSHPTRIPGWETMAFLKEQFFDDDEIVIQYHPAKKDYVNVCQNCLHMWRPHDITIPMPPKEFI